MLIGDDISTTHYLVLSEKMECQCGMWFVRKRQGKWARVNFGPWHVDREHTYGSGIFMNSFPFPHYLHLKYTSLLCW